MIKIGNCFFLACVMFFCFNACKKKESEAICTEGVQPRSENVIYRSHFKSRVYIEPIQLETMDTLKLFELVYNKERGIYENFLRVKAFHNSGPVQYEFQSNQRYIMKSNSDDAEYRYTYENLCP